MKRIIFYIPFEQQYIGEQLAKCYRWCQFIADNKPNHKTYITWHDGHPWPAIEHSTFANAAIYIRGHGSPGGDTISSDVNRTDDVDFQVLGIRLRQAGFNEMSMADIKFWNCNSGSDSGPNRSFAKKCANWLRNMGHTRCKYYAYTESISSYYLDKTGHKGAIGTRSGLNAVFFGASYIKGRASDFRIEV